MTKVNWFDFIVHFFSPESVILSTSGSYTGFQSSLPVLHRKGTFSPPILSSLFYVHVLFSSNSVRGGHCATHYNTWLEWSLSLRDVSTNRWIFSSDNRGMIWQWDKRHPSAPSNPSNFTQPPPPPSSSLPLPPSISLTSHPSNALPFPVFAFHLHYSLIVGASFFYPFSSPVIIQCSNWCPSSELVRVHPLPSRMQY